MITELNSLLRQIKAGYWSERNAGRMENLVFRCPQSRSNVQVWLPEFAQPEGIDSYEAVTCPACARVHLINRKTGKMLGDRMLDDSKPSEKKLGDRGKEG